MPRASLLFLLGLLLLPACGGGGTSAGTTAFPTAKAQVLGVIMTRDGTTADLDGIEVTCDGTGDRALTGLDGTFRLQAPAGRTFRLRFRTQAASQSRGEDLSESDDDTPDDQDLDGDEVVIAALDVDAICEIEIEIDGGDVVEAWIRRRSSDHAGDESEDGEARLCSPDGFDREGARGEIEIDTDDGCIQIEVEIEGLEGPATYEMQLWHPEGDEVSLGDIEVDADGVGRADLEWCEGDALPFDAETVKDLAGVEFVILDDTGTVILRGRLPGRGAHHADRERPRAAWDLVAPDDGPEEDAEGEMLLKFEDKCLNVVIEVSHIFATDSLDVVIVPAEGDEIELGTIEIDELGMGRFVLALCADAEVPEISLDPADVLGLSLELRDADGAVVLVGEMPDIDLPGGFPHDPPTGGHASLLPPDGSAESDASGKVLVMAFGDRGALIVQARQLSASMTLDVVLTCEGDDTTLGEMEIGEQGCGRFGYETNVDTALPFDATSLADLEGCTLSLVDADGTVLLSGTMPEVTTFDGKWQGGDDA